MHLLLINSNRMQPAIAPVGLDYLAAVLQDAGHHVELLDLCWEPDPLAAVKRRLVQMIARFQRGYFEISLPRERSAKQRLRDVRHRAIPFRAHFPGSSGLPCAPVSVIVRRSWELSTLRNRPAPGVRSQESGVRSQESGVRSQESGVAG